MKVPPRYYTLQWTAAKVLRAARGTLVVVEDGRPIPYRLSHDEWLKFVNARQDGFLITSASFKKEIALQNIWWEWCTVLRIPYILLRSGKSRASLSYDLLCNDAVFTEDDIGATGDMLRNFCLARGRYKRDFTIYEFGRIIGRTGKLYRDDALEIAPTLVEIARIAVERARIAFGYPPVEPPAIGAPQEVPSALSLVVSRRRAGRRRSWSVRSD